MKRIVFGSVATVATMIAACPSAAALESGLKDEAPELNALCQAQPSVKSDYTAVAINVVQVPLSTRTEDYNFRGYVPTDVPLSGGNVTWSDPVAVSSTLRSILALRNVSEATYAEAVGTYTTRTTSQAKYTFDCHVHKAMKKNGNDSLHSSWTAPPDEQSYGFETPVFEFFTFGSREEKIHDWTRQAWSGWTAICGESSSNGFKSWLTSDEYDGSLGPCGDSLFNSARPAYS